MKKHKKIKVENVDHILIRDEIFTKERIASIIKHTKADLKDWEDIYKEL